MDCYSPAGSLPATLGALKNHLDRCDHPQLAQGPMKEWE
jgi:hypothetical protein